MFHISKEFKFEASHILHGLDPSHKCGNLHGHSYLVIIGLYGNEVDDRGFVIDYGDLKPIKDWINNTLDHSHLATNEHEADAARQFKKYTNMSRADGYTPQRTCIINAPTSAENIARFIYNTWIAEYPLLSTVTVKETAKTTATYQGNINALDSRDDESIYDDVDIDAVIAKKRHYGGIAGVLSDDPVDEIRGIDPYIDYDNTDVTKSDKHWNNDKQQIVDYDDSLPSTILGIPLVQDLSMSSVGNIELGHIGTLADAMTIQEFVDKSNLMMQELQKSGYRVFDDFDNAIAKIPDEATAQALNDKFLDEASSDPHVLDWQELGLTDDMIGYGDDDDNEGVE